MLETILAFCTRLLPEVRRDGVCLFPDPSHRITLTEKEDNPVFIHDACVAGKWVPLGTIEIEVGQRHFWTRIVEVLRCYTGVVFAMPDGLVASMAVDGLPGADLLTQERVREKTALPRAKVKAGAKLPGFEGTVKSTRKTKTRRSDDNEDDLDDVLGVLRVDAGDGDLRGSEPGEG